MAAAPEGLRRHATAGPWPGTILLSVLAVCGKPGAGGYCCHFLQWTRRPSRRSQLPHTLRSIEIEYVCWVLLLKLPLRVFLCVWQKHATNHHAAVASSGLDGDASPFPPSHHVLSCMHPSGARYGVDIDCCTGLSRMLAAVPPTVGVTCVLLDSCRTNAAMAETSVEGTPGSR